MDGGDRNDRSAAVAIADVRAVSHGTSNASTALPLRAARRLRKSAGAAHPRPDAF